MAINWFNKTVDEVESTLKTNAENGLTAEEAKKRQEEYGLNELKAKKKKSLFVKFLEQFKDFMIIILIISAIISGVVGVAQGEGFTDTIIILVVVVVNAIIGVAQENKAEKSLEALQKLSSHVAKVVRDGKLQVIQSKELVPGDIVILETGDYVPADLRIIEAVNLKSQESALTGESVPVEKMAAKIEDEKIGIGDRVNMLFSSSLITYGRGKAVVVETGMNTEVGKIADIINTAEEQGTPLQQKLNKLGKTLGIVALAICAVIFVVGLLYGKEPIHMFMTAVSLAVAAIPEGLPAVFTIVLAIGVQRMVKRNAIVKKLPAVETLGSASVICSDKTGTLTQNKMTVEKVFCDGNLVNLEESADMIDIQKLVYASMLCNDTKISEDDKLTGDPTETALVDMAFKLDFDPSVYGMFPRVAEIPFDSDRKLMTTVHEENGNYVVYTKGGVDELLANCSSYILEGDIKTDLEEYKEIIRRYNMEMAQNALRVLAMAYKVLDHKPTAEEIKELESNLTYIGMVGMIDPPRLEVKDAVQECKEAGIKTVMITGDHKITAIAIAKSLGILENDDEAITGTELEEMSDEELIRNVRKYSVYARVSPEHKVRIVKAWQANGETVAMTGDGVNDAPSLKIADIGCAMGVVGTDVAKEAADVILTDDNFATVVSAVEEGRRIYDNILKAIQFLLSSNIGEIVVLFLAILITPLLSKQFGVDITLIETLLPIHILWINLVTDSLPALALAVDPAADNVMKRKPLKNTKKGIFTKGMTWRIVYQGLMIGLLTLTAFIIGLSTPDVSQEEKVKIGQTMAFYVLALSELVHVFNIRDNKRSIFKTGIFNNSKLILATVVSASLMFVILFTQGLRDIFGLVMLPAMHVFETVMLVLAPVIIVEIFKLLKINTTKDEE
ncbi:MAG: calcium-translocating P-type ATPase, PMCA-type [Clostridia bacterium]|jgi:calcium-translocating P-type ATPase, PMCA-type|nr:calcium-translocating P-type ATPase, PMCA-type [Clostridiaceae bacterium]